MFSAFYTNENGIQDSLLYSFKQNDSLNVVCIKRKKTDPLPTYDKEVQKMVMRLEPK